MPDAAHATPYVRLNIAAAAAPLANPAVPLPASVETVPFGAMTRMRVSSATTAFPALSRHEPRGKIKRAAAATPSAKLETLRAPESAVATHTGSGTGSTARPEPQSGPHAHGTGIAVPPAHVKPAVHGTPLALTLPAGQ